MATAPAFAATPKIGAVKISTANTNHDGTGTVGTVLTAGASGTKVTRVVIHGQTTTTAGMVRLFIHDGSNYTLLDEIPILAITVAATQKGHHTEVAYADMVLPTGYSLRASTEKGETLVVTAFGADL